MKKYLLLGLGLVLLASLTGCRQPVVSIKEPEQALGRYLKAWQWADADTMYGLLSSRDQALVTAGEYQADLEDLPRPVSYTITGGQAKGPEARINVELEMPALNYKGSKDLKVTVKQAVFYLVREKSGWKVNEVKTFKDW